MNKTRLILIIGALVIALSVSAVALAAGPKGEKSFGYDVTATFVDKPVSFCTLATGESQYLEGDIFNLGDVGGVKIGTFHAKRVRIGVGPECESFGETVARVTDKGDIHISFTGDEAAPLDDRIAVVGGTGDFAGATGSCVRLPLAGDANARFTCVTR